MKIAAAILLFALAVASAGHTSKNYADYMSKHGKKANTSEKGNREKLWKVRKVQIDAHNIKYSKGLTTYTQEENQFSDMTSAELAAMLPAMDAPVLRTESVFHGSVDRAFPASLNLTTSKCMAPIKNQAYCGACWAFSAINPIEYQLCIKTGKLVQLSEQQLVSCSGAYGNAGCGGGWYYYSWRYIFGNGGIASSAAYPYTSSNGAVPACVSKPKVANVFGYSLIFKNETVMQQAIASFGPISVAIHVNSNFQAYKSGVYKDTTCFNNGTVNHAVNLIGYGTDAAAGKFWILRNQWGTSWGEKGYMRIARDVNTCGIAMYASYPNLYL